MGFFVPPAHYHLDPPMLIIRTKSPRPHLSISIAHIPIRLCILKPNATMSCLLDLFQM